MNSVKEAAMASIETDIVNRLEATLAEWPDLQAAFLFGSLANDTAQVDSDLDLAVQMNGTLTAEKKIARLRHKTKKLSFRAFFWFTVLVNLGVVGWLHSPQGNDMLRQGAVQVEHVVNASVSHPGAVSTAFFLTKFRATH